MSNSINPIDPMKQAAITYSDGYSLTQSKPGSFGYKPRFTNDDLFVPETRTPKGINDA